MLGAADCSTLPHVHSVAIRNHADQNQLIEVSQSLPICCEETPGPRHQRRLLTGDGLHFQRFNPLSWQGIEWLAGIMV